MSASFYDLMKYAKTGIASPSMTQYDMLKARSMFGGGGFPVNTLTGVDSIDFKSDGTPLDSWHVKGNEAQTGTPAPNNIIMPQECGDPTANLADISDTTAAWGTNSNPIKTALNALQSGTYTISFVVQLTERNDITDGSVCGITINSTAFSAISVSQQLGAATVGDSLTVSCAITLDSASIGTISSVYLYGCGKSGVGATGNAAIKKIMLNTGSTALPFEHFGYKIDISCGGQTYTSYLQEPIRKIGDYADIASAVGTVGTATRRIKKAVFNGTENWQYSRSGSNTRVFLQLESNCLSLSPAICTHFVYNADNIGYPRKSEFVINSVRSIIIGINGDNFADAAAFKQWLSDNYSAGTPVCIWYVLAEPQTETFTAPTITPTNGANVLTVGTTLPPSEVSITGHIKSN